MSCSRGCCSTQREHYLSVAISSTCTPTRASSIKARQTQDVADSWDKDIPAYKRLVKSGVQPDSVDGAAQLERQVDSSEG